MRVKRFVGKTIQEAMLQVKLEMGKDALILQTRKFKEGGFLGFFAKEYVEVTAATETDNLDRALLEGKKRQEKEEKERKEPVEQRQSFDRYEELRKKIREEREAHIREKEAEEQDNLPERALLDKIKENSNKLEDEQLDDAEIILDADQTTEFQEMKQLVEGVLKKIEQSEQKKEYTGIEKRVLGTLLENDVEEKLAKLLIRNNREYLQRVQNDDFTIAEDKIKESMISLLTEPKPLNPKLKKNRQEVVVFVGPTGVGKTTTIAKLAAEFAINHQKRVALVTSDTYRIAAVEQLKTVGDIIGIPVEVVFSPQNMKAEISKLTDRDIVFVDTAGRSHKNALHMAELKSMVEAAQPDEVFLVLSATTKYRDMMEIVKNYKEIAFNNIIFTKLDETSIYGSLFNVIYYTKKNLSYFTTGQSVPDDIEVADLEKIAQLVWGDNR